VDTDLCIKREAYVATLSSFIGKPVIKALTGMRRCGKSAILKLFHQKLLENGIAEKHILFLNFESISIDSLTNAEALYAYIRDFAKAADGHFYILLDEIQYVSSWERAIASCRVDFDCDIYITGSNAKLLAGELHTLLAGRFVTIPVYPLSFSEFLVFTKAFGEDGGKDTNSQFLDYLRFGGLPGIHEMNINSFSVHAYLIDVFNSVLLKDVISRSRIRNIDILARILQFIMDNIGNIFTAKSVSDFMKNQSLRLGAETVYNYILALSEAYLVRKVSRYNIKGKRLLETYQKYFIEDHGLKHAFSGYNDANISGLLENVVFMELLRRGFNVYIGQLLQKEIDFIATRGDEKYYIQVCYLLADDTVVEREFSPLREIRDNYPKLVLSMDPIWNYNKDGIERRNIVDWLLASSTVPRAGV
jgi:predicted AAA+ superfamily ATPase